MGFGLRQKLGTFWWVVTKELMHAGGAFAATFTLMKLLPFAYQGDVRFMSVYLVMAFVVLMEAVHNARGQESWKWAIDLVVWFSVSCLTAMWMYRGGLDGVS